MPFTLVSRKGSGWKILNTVHMSPCCTRDHDESERSVAICRQVWSNYDYIMYIYVFRLVIELRFSLKNLSFSALFLYLYSCDLPSGPPPTLHRGFDQTIFHRFHESMTFARISARISRHSSSILVFVRPFFFTWIDVGFYNYDSK